MDRDADPRGRYTHVSAVASAPADDAMGEPARQLHVRSRNDRALRAMRFGVRRTRERLSVMRQWTFVRLLALGAACLNPYGPEMILVTFRTIALGGALTTITEWRSQDFTHLGGFEIVMLAAFGFALYRGVDLAVAANCDAARSSPPEPLASAPCRPAWNAGADISGAAVGRTIHDDGRRSDADGVAPSAWPPVATLRHADCCHRFGVAPKRYVSTDQNHADRTQFAFDRHRPELVRSLMTTILAAISISSASRLSSTAVPNFTASLHPSLRPSRAQPGKTFRTSCGCSTNIAFGVTLFAPSTPAVGLLDRLPSGNASMPTTLPSCTSGADSSRGRQRGL